MASCPGPSESRGRNRLVNGLFAAASAPDYLSFQLRQRDFRRVQEQKLLGYLRRNRDTAFGRRHGFDRLDSVEAYQQHVPPGSYEDFRPWVERIAAGEPRVLTAEKVLLLEPTGGTRSGSKLIPYTRSLKREFQAAVHAWVFDLYRAFPGLYGTRSYWSITPVAAERQATAAGIPIGFEADSDYLGVLGGLLKSVFPVPGEVSRVRNLENFRYLTAIFLLRARDLGLVSVWNPTFLMLLLEYLETHLSPLLRDLADGRLRLPGPAEDRFPETGLSPCPARAREIESAFASSGNHRYQRVWPGLRVISCWADGVSRSYAEQLGAMFPGVHLQPKGLLATEGVVSFPLGAIPGGVVAYLSHFFEFFPVGGGPPCLLHRLEAGGEYTVAITTGGGLYRYSLGDRVRVSGSYRGLPAIRFCGRDHVSDLVGEKLEESHVQAAVEAALREEGVPCVFLLFAPERTASGGFYALFLEPATVPDPARRERLIEGIDRRLGENMQYRYARQLGQLERPALVVLERGLGQRAYLARCLESGQRLGDIKQTLLDHRTGWVEWFADKEVSR